MELQPVTIKDPSRTAYNWIFRILADRRRAKILLTRVDGLNTGDSAEGLLRAIREILETDLAAEEFGRCILGNPSPALTDLPVLEAGSHDLASMQDGLVKDRLHSGQLGLVELALVDRIPVPILASHLGASVPMVYGFLIQVVDLLAGATAFELPVSAPHPSRIVQDAIDEHIQSVRPTPDPDGAAPHSGETDADPVSVLVERCREAIAVLAQDSRILSLSSRGFVSQALQGPKVVAAPREGWTETAFKGMARHDESPTSVPSTVPPGDTTHRHSLALAVLLAAFLPVVVVLFSEDPPVSLTGGEGSGVVVEPSLMVGTYADKITQSRPLLLGQRVSTGPETSYAVSLFVGLSLYLEPRTSIVVTREGLQVFEGVAEIVTDWPKDPGFPVRLGRVVIIIKECTLKLQVENGAVSVAVQRGRIMLSQPAEDSRDLAEGEGFVVSSAGDFIWSP